MSEAARFVQVPSDRGQSIGSGRDVSGEQEREIPVGGLHTGAPRGKPATIGPPLHANRKERAAAQGRLGRLVRPTVDDDDSDPRTVTARRR